MALPKLDMPTYNLILPSNKKKIKYRPFLVKEEKILLMANEGDDIEEQIDAAKQVISNCIITSGIKVETLATFDIEYLFVNIRSKSVGNIIQLNYKHDCANKSEDGTLVQCDVRFDINLDNVEIENTEDHTNKIELTDMVGVIMKYPDFKMLTGIKNLNNFDDTMKMLKNCIEYIYDGDEVHDINDYNDEEVFSFLESLSQGQFQKINNFFETMPQCVTDADVKCPDCGWTNSFKLRGISDFFV
jgi:hypothetical protein